MIPSRFQRYATARNQGLLVALIFVGVILWIFWPHPTERITNYAECVAEGYPVLETYPPICKAGNDSFTGPGVAPTPPEYVINQDFEILVNGDLGKNYPRENTVINDSATWSAYWTKLHAGLKTMPPLLPVDFSKNTVVVITQGQKPTTGYVYKVTAISQGKTGYVVDVSEFSPGRSCFTAQQLSNRYYIVRTTKLKNPISFRITADTRNCDAVDATTDTVQ